MDVLQAKNILRNFKYPKDLLDIIKTLEEAGFEVYIVGGAIRDILRLEGAVDPEEIEFDLATNGTPDVVMNILKKKRFLVVPTGIRHGTVSVILDKEKNKKVEITTYRIEGKYSDARHPDYVKFVGTIEEDIGRRDFTINGMAYSISTDRFVDIYDGLGDLERKLIRAIGDPLERFKEDGLRPFRACRFRAQLGFDIEQNTFLAMQQSIEYAKMVSMERIRDEFVKILQTPKPSIGIECLRESGLLSVFLPELVEAYGFSQNIYHKYDLYHHSLYACDNAPRNNLVVRMSALLHDIGKLRTKKTVEKDGDTETVFYMHDMVSARMAKEILRRLHFDKKFIEKVTNLIRNHMFYYTDEWTDRAIRRFIRKVGLENIDDLFALRLADRDAIGTRDKLDKEPEYLERLKKRIEKILEEQNAFSIKDLAVNGYDVMNEYGINPGPLVGKLLKYFLEVCLDDPTKNSKEILLGLGWQYLKENNLIDQVGNKEKAKKILEKL